MLIKRLHLAFGSSNTQHHNLISESRNVFLKKYVLVKHKKYLILKITICRYPHCLTSISFKKTLLHKEQYFGMFHVPCGIEDV